MLSKPNIQNSPDLLKINESIGRSDFPIYDTHTNTLGTLLNKMQILTEQLWGEAKIPHLTCSW